MKEYEIDGKVFCLPEEEDELIIAQSEDIAGFIKENVDIDKVFKSDGGIDIPRFLLSLGSKTSVILAILLTPKGVAYKDKNIDELADHFRYNFSFKKSVKIVSDFFIAQGLGDIIPVPQTKKQKKR